MNKQCKDYIEEIQVWQKASKLHASKSIEQYKKVLDNVELLNKQKTENDEILDKIKDVLIVFKNNKILIFNKYARELFGYLKSEVIGKNISILEKSVNFHELYLLLKYSAISEYLIEINKQIFQVNIDTIHVYDDILKIVILNNVSEVYQLQKELKKEKALLEKKVIQRTKEVEQLALMDSLTNLPNRAAFERKIQDLRKKYEEENYYEISVFFLDLDGFKAVNDTYGHNTGDLLLKNISKEMRKIIRTSDFLARLGGDEFVIVLEKIPTRQKIELIANSLLQITQKKLIPDIPNLNISFSIGIIYNPPVAYDLSTILSLADNAMYHIKTHGKNGYKFFDESMLIEYKKKNSIVTKLEAAFKNNEFFLVFQPICNQHKEIVGCEALSRWKHNGQIISPTEFIPVLEEKGLISKFTYHMIDTVFEHLLEYTCMKSVSINLSMYQFYDNRLLSFLEEKVFMYPELIGKINFEITESLFAEESELIAKKVKDIKKLGFKFYIDDFGTGYSSFLYIKKFRLDVLKIDKIFIDNIVDNKKDFQLVKGMIELASALDISVIIEGVETQEQFNLIFTLGDTIRVQGYYCYRPMNIKEIKDLIKS